ncbi:hypothetical protein [Bradyrhizobium sp. DOA1]|uniref:hypothetical protein n=1 Tax=Bradyrhizobium sp. DOA1 TaxID=1126616 RepID=UPI000A8BC17D|nr:hypothetical protein [Bradyrhizobium sp. DOA1]
MVEDSAGQSGAAAKSIASRWYIAVSIVPDQAKPGLTERRHWAASATEEGAISRLNAERLAGMAADLPKRELCRASRAKSGPGFRVSRSVYWLINLDLRK